MYKVEKLDVMVQNGFYFENQHMTIGLNQMKYKSAEEKSFFGDQCIIYNVLISIISSFSSPCNQLGKNSNNLKVDSLSQTCIPSSPTNYKSNTRLFFSYGCLHKTVEFLL